MTEEYWANWKSKRDERHGNIIWKSLENQQRFDMTRDKHPDQNYAVCRTDNNYWRHYRASKKLGIDELSMMICRDVGCDLMYCQHLFAKPKTKDQQISDCKSQFDEFRQCVVREKRMFRSIVGDIKKNNDPNAIVDYLDKHFKEKEAQKKARKMMGEDLGNDLKQKIAEMEEKASISKNKVNITEFKQKKKTAMEESYM